MRRDKTKPKIVSAGSLFVDVIVDVDGRFVSSSTGGSASNVMTALNALGVEAIPVGTIGSDKLGTLLTEAYVRLGIDVGFVRQSAGLCTVVVFQHQLFPARGKTHRFGYGCPRCGRRCEPRPARLDAEQLSGVIKVHNDATVFYFDVATPLTVVLAQSLKSEGCVVFFELNQWGYPPDLIEQSILLADIVKYSSNQQLPSTANVSSVGIEIQTLGGRGLRFRSLATGGEWYSLPPYQAMGIVDTSGAGDWCSAGLIYEITLREKRRSIFYDHAVLVDALSFAQAMAALNCQSPGALGLLSNCTADDVIDCARNISRSLGGSIGPSSPVIQSSSFPLRQSLSAGFPCHEALSKPSG